MDPKMDSGCLAPGESLDVDYDVTRSLLPQEVLGIIDQLLCLEVRPRLHPLLAVMPCGPAQASCSSTNPRADGMAPWLSSLPDAAHKRLYRSHAEPVTGDHRRCRFRQVTPRGGDEGSDAHGAKGIHPRLAEGLLVRK